MKSDNVRAVEMVREIRDAHLAVVQDMTVEQRRAFYAERARRLHERLGIDTKAAERV